MSNVGNNAIRSMTGFGAAEVERDGISAQVEIRSVNHRNLKLNVRSRPSLGAHEKTLRDLVQKAIRRGAVDVYITASRTLQPGNLPIREDLAEAVVGRLGNLAQRLNLSGTLQASDLLQVPGLFDMSPEGAVGDAEWALVEEAAQAALSQVMAMRETEGAATAESLRALLAPLENFARDAAKLAPQVVDRARTRLADRLAEIRPDGLQAGDQQALERELCFFADKADIHEEMERLAGHLSQFRSALDAGGEIGKRLDFLSQELLREVNTTASKANDLAITQQAVEAKLAVEKIKEQAANVE